MKNRLIGCVWAGAVAMLFCLLLAAEPLKIGMVAPLTGPAAGPEAARYLIQGAQLAAEEVNKAGGVLGKNKWAIVHSTDAYGYQCHEEPRRGAQRDGR